MQEDELKQYFDVFNECWKLIKKYGSIEEGPQYWERLIDEGTQIAASHEGKFANDVVVAILHEMERRAKAC